VVDNLAGVVNVRHLPPFLSLHANPAVYLVFVSQSLSMPSKRCSWWRLALVFYSLLSLLAFVVANEEAHTGALFSIISC
jgi:hypothetical protein